MIKAVICSLIFLSSQFTAEELAAYLPYCASCLFKSSLVSCYDGTTQSFSFRRCLIKWGWRCVSHLTHFGGLGGCGRAMIDSFQLRIQAQKSLACIVSPPQVRRETGSVYYTLTDCERLR
ncbi:hypothetical protein Dimus_032566 [Dionaea muscipula]